METRRRRKKIRGMPQKAKLRKPSSNENIIADARKSMSCISSGVNIMNDAFEFVALNEGIAMNAFNAIKEFSQKLDSHSCGMHNKENERNGPTTTTTTCRRDDVESLLIPYPLTRESFGVGRKI